MDLHHIPTNPCSIHKTTKSRMITTPTDDKIHKIRKNSKTYMGERKKKKMTFSQIKSINSTQLNSINSVLAMPRFKSIYNWNPSQVGGWDWVVWSTLRC